MLAISAHLLGIVLAAANPVPASNLSITTCDLGEVYAFNSAQCEITLANMGSHPIRIFDVATGTKEDSLTPAVLTLAPHSKSYMQATVKAGDEIGNFHHSFRFQTDEPGHEQRIFNVFGFGLSVLDQVRPQINFGVVTLGDKPVERRIEFSSHESANLSVTKILSKPDFVDVYVSPDKRGISVRMKPDARWGLHSDLIELAIDAPRQPKVWVRVLADVHGAVVASSNPFDMGLMRFGNRNEFKIRLASLSGADFRVGDIKLENLLAKYAIGECAPIQKGCKLLTLVISDQQAAGAILGHAWIDFPDYHQRMNLALWGLIVPKDMEIPKIEKMSEGADGKTNGGQTIRGETSSSMDLSKALKGAVDQLNAAPPPGNGPLLKWTIANGRSIHGFQIFRGDAESGPFILMNPSTIPSTALTEDPVRYQWRDVTAKSGRAYWYFIGVVYNDGTKQQLSGPQEVKAK